MHDDGHMVCVRGVEDLPKSRDVLRAVKVDIRIAKKWSLRPKWEVRILRAAGQFAESIIFERVYAAERDEPVREASHLLTRPVGEDKITSCRADVRRPDSRRR